MLAALFSGVFFGCGLALIYMRGSSTGGTDFLTMSIKALHPHLSLGAVTMAIDLVIILIGWPVFGNLDAVLYGLISTFVTSTVIDKIMYGTSAGKLAIIITTQGPAMATHIDEVCARGSTLIRARGSYTTTDRQVLLCACSKAEAYKVRRAAHQTDPDAFVMITETSEVFGEGFIDPTDNVKYNRIYEKTAHSIVRNKSEARQQLPSPPQKEKGTEHPYEISQIFTGRRHDRLCRPFLWLCNLPLSGNV